MKTYLEELETLSQGREDGGLIHGGHIHFIQGKLSDEDGLPFLKAAIYKVLERIPEMIPPDLPELAEKDSFEPSEMLIKAMEEINDNLLMPCEGYDVIRIIKAAREYESLARSVQ